MRLSCIVVLALAASACCSAPPAAPDFTTPEATLLTFHEAFKNDRAVAELECFSTEFKRRNGNLGLSQYYDMRAIIEEEYPMATWVFSLQDLDDNIVDRFVSLKDGRAWLKLSVYGREITINFTREVVCRLEFDESKTVVEELLDPQAELIQPRGGALEVLLPLTGRWARLAMKLYPSWRMALVEKRWKFLDFSFLSEKMSGSAE